MSGKHFLKRCRACQKPMGQFQQPATEYEIVWGVCDECRLSGVYIPQLKDNEVHCSFCGKPTDYTGTRLCNPCWESEKGLDTWLRYPEARHHTSKLLRQHIDINVDQFVIFSRDHIAEYNRVQTVHKRVLMLLDEREEAERESHWEHDNAIRASWYSELVDRLAEVMKWEPRKRHAVPAPERKGEPNGQA